MPEEATVAPVVSDITKLIVILSGAFYTRLPPRRGKAFIKNNASLSFIKLKRAHSVLPRHSEQMHKHLRGIPDGKKGLILTIVETMYQTDRDLGRGYRETSENGLAKLYREGDGACE